MFVIACDCVARACAQLLHRATLMC